MSLLCRRYICVSWFDETLWLVTEHPRTQVFLSKKQTRFHPKYTASFYQIFEAGLKDENLRSVCIVSCRGLLQARVAHTLTLSLHTTHAQKRARYLHRTRTNACRTEAADARDTDPIGP